MLIADLRNIDDYLGASTATTILHCEDIIILKFGCPNLLDMIQRFANAAERGGRPRDVRR
jgi:hypothetical protein